MVNAGDCRCQRGLGLTAGCRRFVLQKVPFFRAGSASPMAAGGLFCKKYLFSAWARLPRWRPAVCFAKSTFFSQGLGLTDGGRRFVLQKVPFFAGARLARWAAGGLFCISSLLLEVLWLIRMQSYICTMIIAVLRLRLKVGIVGEVETQEPRGAFAVEPAGRFRRSDGCAPCSGLSTGSRRSLSPKARVTFSSVEEWGCRLLTAPRRGCPGLARCRGRGR